MYIEDRSQCAQTLGGRFVVGKMLMMRVSPFSGLVVLTAIFSCVISASLLARGAKLDAAGQANVLQFGADPSGHADSSQAFRSAIGELKKAGGGRVLIPCGTYVLSSSRDSASVVIDTPTISMVGANQSCVVLSYKGDGIALTFQMSPFTIRPAGRLSDFTISGTQDGQIGINTGGLVGATFENLQVTGFTRGEAFRLEDSVAAAPPSGSWTERTVWTGVSEAHNKVGWRLMTTGRPRNDSFGYNDFLNISINVSRGQVGFWLDKDSYLYNGSVRAICNADGGGSDAEPPICIRSSGNWADEFVWLSGEFAQGGIGRSLGATALRVDNGASFTGFGQIKVAGASVVNLNPATFQQSVHLLNSAQSWDTGTMQAGGVQGSPQVVFGGRGANLGIIRGKDLESPFVTMYDAPGNSFKVANLKFGLPLSSMTDLWTVDNGGNVNVSGSEHSSGAVSADNGFLIPSFAKRPDCDGSKRGTIWVNQSDTAAGDSLEVCQKVGFSFTWVKH